MRKSRDWPNASLAMKLFVTEGGECASGAEGATWGFISLSAMVPDYAASDSGVVNGSFVRKRSLEAESLLIFLVFNNIYAPQIAHDLP